MGTAQTSRDGTSVLRTAGAPDCSGRDKRRLRRLARALLFLFANTQCVRATGCEAQGAKRFDREPPLGAAGASRVAGSAQRLRANEHGEAGGRGIEQRGASPHFTASVFARCAGIEHSAHYAAAADCAAHNDPCVMFACTPKAPFGGWGAVRACKRFGLEARTVNNSAARALRGC